jgi:hypothetical protein
VRQVRLTVLRTRYNVDEINAFESIVVIHQLSEPYLRANVCVPFLVKLIELVTIFRDGHFDERVFRHNVADVGPSAGDITSLFQLCPEQDIQQVERDQQLAMSHLQSLLGEQTIVNRKILTRREVWDMIEELEKGTDNH